MKKFIKYVADILFFSNILLKDTACFFLVSPDTQKLNHLDIEPTNICNANCVFCAYQYQSGPKYKSMDLNLAERLLSAFCIAGGGDIGLTPIVGDPLVSPDIEKLAALCRSKKEIRGIGLTTNAILLTVDKFRKLKDAGVTNINVSMTYPDEDEYEKIYRSKNFKDVIKNLSGLMELDQKSVSITLNVRTPRFFWKNHILFKKATAAGWKVIRNFYFDDWSGAVSLGLKQNYLFKRPLRGRHLPCTMLQTGPHALASGKITACGCRDLEGKSELADKSLFEPFYERGDLYAVYYGTMDTIRKRFLNGPPPKICATCRHYNPEYRFASMADKFQQIGADITMLFRGDSH